MSVSDEQLIARAVVGDEDALSALLERYGPVVRRKLRGKIDKRWQSVLGEDDVMQQTYVDAFQSISRFEPRGERSFQRWLTTLAQNNLRDAVKGLRTVKSGGDRVRVAIWQYASGSSPMNASNNSRASFRAAVSQQDDDSHLRLLENLGGSTTSPSKQRRYDLDGVSIQQVAAEASCSPGAVFMRRARAHARLKELFGSESRF